jgi:hypothetical protein
LARGERHQKRREVFLRPQSAHRPDDHGAWRHGIVPGGNRGAPKAAHIETVIAKVNVSWYHPFVGGQVLTDGLAVDDDAIGQSIGHPQTGSKRRSEDLSKAALTSQDDRPPKEASRYREKQTAGRVESMNDAYPMLPQVSAKRSDRRPQVRQRSKRPDWELHQRNPIRVDLPGADTAVSEAADMHLETVSVERARHFAQLALGSSQVELTCKQQHWIAVRTWIHHWRRLECPKQDLAPLRNHGGFPVTSAWQDLTDATEPPF